jgi:pimeloyl-ACP methyl ester carboxylesterase
MYADAEAIAQAAAAIDGPVVVVAHSYGGIPTTQGLAHAKNVRRIIYIAASQLSAGESLQSLQGGSLMPWSRLHPRRAVSQLGYRSYASMRQPLTETAWRTIPSTYVSCERDNALPVAVQEVLAERADDVQRLSTSHSPFLSQPAALARLIRRSLARSSTTEF